jgi:hypothetical protein
MTAMNALVQAISIRMMMPIDTLSQNSLGSRQENFQNHSLGLSFSTERGRISSCELCNY